MTPLPTVPETWMRRMTGAAGSPGASILVAPLRTDTSPASTTMPGLVIRVSAPLRTSASIRSDGWVITAPVKSSVTVPLATRTSIRRGTTQGPSRVTLLLPQSMRTRSFGSGSGAPGTRPGTAGRSLTRAASCPWVRAVSATPSRSSSSSAVSRPAPAATRRISATRSRSSCDARSWSGDAASSSRPGGATSPVMAQLYGRAGRPRMSVVAAIPAG